MRQSGFGNSCNSAACFSALLCQVIPCGTVMVFLGIRTVFSSHSLNSLVIMPMMNIRIMGMRVGQRLMDVQMGVS
jgi:hypothetical protein